METSSLFPIPDCSWECRQCHTIFGSFSEFAYPTECPECHSTDIEGGPIVHGGPWPGIEKFY